MAVRRTKRSTTSARNRAESGEQSEMSTELHQLFLEELADIYNAEQQLIKALPRMAKAAQAEELREAFESHLAETEQQAQRIEEAVEALGEGADHTEVMRLIETRSGPG